MPVLSFSLPLFGSVSRSVKGNDIFADCYRILMVSYGNKGIRLNIASLIPRLGNNNSFGVALDLRHACTEQFDRRTRSLHVYFFSWILCTLFFFLFLSFFRFFRVRRTSFGIARVSAFLWDRIGHNSVYLRADKRLEVNECPVQTF